MPKILHLLKRDPCKININDNRNFESIDYKYYNI